MSDFYNAVYALVRQIPRGKVLSYGQIAKLLGNPHASRAVGWAMRRSPDNIPWQRVVKSDGSITGGEYAELRRALLEDEGVPFMLDGRVNIALCSWCADLSKGENHD